MHKHICCDLESREQYVASERTAHPNFNSLFTYWMIETWLLCCLKFERRCALTVVTKQQLDQK